MRPDSESGRHYGERLTLMNADVFDRWTMGMALIALLILLLR